MPVNFFFLNLLNNKSQNCPVFCSTPDSPSFIAGGGSCCVMENNGGQAGKTSAELLSLCGSALVSFSPPRSNHQF